MNVQQECRRQHPQSRVGASPTWFLQHLPVGQRERARQASVPIPAKKNIKILCPAPNTCWNENDAHWSAFFISNLAVPILLLLRQLFDRVHLIRKIVLDRTVTVVDTAIDTKR
jgi:hypothetical protein